MTLRILAVSSAWRLALITIVATGGWDAARGQVDPESLLRQANELRRATRFEEARAIFEDVEKWARDQSEPDLEVVALIGLCDLEREAGNAPGGRGYCDRALSRFGPGVEPELEARIYRQRAQVRAAVKDRAGAAADLETAATIYARLGKDVEVAGVDATRSVMATWAGDWPAAVSYGQASLPVLLEHGKQAEAIGALSAIAYGLQELGRHEESLEAYDRLIPLAWERSDQQVLNFAFCNRATVRWALGDAKASEEDLRRAIAGIEETRGRIPAGAESRQEYFAAHHSAYDDLILLLAQSYRGMEAFEIAERFHGRSFLELLDESALDRATDASDLRRRERSLLQALGEARMALEAEPSPPARSDLERLRSELRETRAEIRRADSRYAELTQPTPPTLPEIQASLETGEALVAYWVGEQQTFAWTLTRETQAFGVIPVSRADLRAATLAYLAPLGSVEMARDGALKGTEAEHIELGRSLYDWLVGSLPSAVRDFERLTFVRDDFLHYLPFEALIEDCDEVADSPASDLAHAPYRACRFLGLEKAISYAPSAGSLRKLRDGRPAPTRIQPSLLAMAPFATVGPGADAQRSATGGSLLGLGPLRFSQVEIERVAAAMPGPRSHLDGEATESNFKSLAPRYRTLHLATHGLITDSLPMTSGVLLQADDREDGLLQANEVLGLELDAELVTLSACRTGRGALHRGEGILGLSRAFLYAGARSVVVSMWDVDDRPTPDLMGAFYRALAAGQGPAEALRLARRELFSQTGTERWVVRDREVSFAHPRYWAAFVVNGGS